MHDINKISYGNKWNQMKSKDLKFKKSPEWAEEKNGKNRKEL